ncbi:MAG: hypothetical protein H6766_03820 [Candidatus Peribacteria bacterium]|nr:MAG: hypothetical protein H6766_03820 [Candidatus Peribacteria bacterium]
MASIDVRYHTNAPVPLFSSTVFPERMIEVGDVLNVVEPGVGVVHVSQSTLVSVSVVVILHTVSPAPA